MKKICFILLMLFFIGSCYPMEPVKANWIMINYTAYQHVIDIKINGNKTVVMDKGSGIESKTSSLKDGINKIEVSFKQKEPVKSGSGSMARIFWGPEMMPGKNPLPGVEILDVEGSCECNIELLVKDKIPQSIKYIRKDWLTNKKKTLAYEEQVEKKAFSEEYDKEVYKVWTPQGKLYSEEFYIKGKLDAAKYYTPQAKIGAEVIKGKGYIREWYDSGKLYTEVPVVNGMRNGTLKEYSEEGKVISKVQYKDGEEVPEKK